MSQKISNSEMKIAEIHGNEGAKRGLNGVIISFALIILTIIGGVFVAAIGQGKSKIK